MNTNGKTFGEVVTDMLDMMADAASDPMKAVFNNLIIFFWQYSSESDKRIGIRGDYTMSEIVNMLNTFERCKKIHGECRCGCGAWYSFSTDSKETLIVRDIINDVEVLRIALKPEDKETDDTNTKESV